MLNLNEFVNNTQRWSGNKVIGLAFFCNHVSWEVVRNGFGG